MTGAEGQMGTESRLKTDPTAGRDRSARTGVMRPMITVLVLAALLTVALTVLQRRQADPVSRLVPDPALQVEGETHLVNIRQLTFGGQNAEAYWSPDGRHLIFQSTRPPYDCDQIFIMDADGTDVRMVSTGEGRTTCSYFMPGGRILYASTHEGGAACPPEPDFSQGYVWALYPSYDIFTADRDGTDLRPLTRTPGYDAEATLNRAGDRIVFTSVRDGDLELYTMAVDGSEVRRITDAPGYDGGAFFSHDGSMLVWRASRPTGEDLADYRRLLADGLIRPSHLEIYVSDAEGNDVRQVTDNGAANFGPYFHPSDEKIIFSSNLADPQGRNFDLWMVDVDGSGLERVTYYEEFDGFPMFSPDGRYLVFASNRNGSEPGETNVFIADWVEGIPGGDAGR
jgi:Tol biopolymer transport system component